MRLSLLKVIFVLSWFVVVRVSSCRAVGFCCLFRALM